MVIPPKYVVRKVVESIKKNTSKSLKKEIRLPEERLTGTTME